MDRGMTGSHGVREKGQKEEEAEQDDSCDGERGGVNGTVLQQFTLTDQ